ncbi:MAG: hypothetical protein LBL58_12470, partial [Tannerellaceae bacterium]|nr:hypothetical protein [Tannerellaceae bacterium]
KNRITYNRIKTKNRRADKAEISIKIEPEIKKLIEKYRDPIDGANRKVLDLVKLNIEHVEEVKIKKKRI